MHSHGTSGPDFDSDILDADEQRVHRRLLVALLPFLILTVVGIVTFWPSHSHHSVPTQFQDQSGGKLTFVGGKVTRVDIATCTTAGNGPQAQCRTARVSLDNGRTASLEYPAQRTGGAPYLQEGDKIRVAQTTSPLDGSALYQFDDFQRGVPLGLVGLVFAVLVVAVARWRGLAALGGLVVTYLTLAYFLLPALLDGQAPVAVALISSATIMFVVLYLAHGFTTRTTVALLGTLTSLCIAAVVAHVALDSSSITGLSSEESTLLQSAAPNISIVGLLTCGFIIGTLGVLNDMTVTQASAVWELKAARPSATARDLFGSAMRIGRDHIASTVYTLVLAYAGAGLPTLLLFDVAGRSISNTITGDEVATEVLRSLTGAIGLVLAVPITTALAAIVAANARSYPA